MNIFKLPDLGEGLQEAEIVEWHVKEGDEIKVDQALLSVETAKAIVDIPSPHNGIIHKLYVEAGDIPLVGDPLVEFELADSDEKPASAPQDQGTVVGEMESGKGVIKEAPTAVGGAGSKSGGGGGNIKVTPAVRALASRMKVDLSVVTPSGKAGVITAADVQRVAKILADAGPMEPLRGVRRAMAHIMTQAHEEVADVTICDDADIDSWQKGSDTTLRLIRAIAVGCHAEPSLNAWYDGHAVGRRLRDKVDLGIAVDTAEGLFVPVLRDITERTPEDLRGALNQVKKDVKARTIPAEEMRGYTFTLSNFGAFGGRYADPIVVPPTVAILGAGRARDEVIAIDRQAVVHTMLPLSLTVDHRCVTGGEAARFLAAVIKDLNKAE
ncbi:Dihydrolipoamide acyltransferase component of branched-chain alpha-keto acid dehydrogenase complex [hydrothermal vent metagenome]|uniref:Dihydrolipoamide acyltransferase component of branched-chain alpha-keto acid dehydrogenase complex n=1 Tax=hydrothermal vent metagenome TaxID=652676 RepID=A0A3B0ZSA8_9ZZZZ